MTHRPLHPAEPDATAQKRTRVPEKTGLFRLWLATLMLTAASCSVAPPAYAAAPGGPSVLRIGYQKFNTLNLLKAKGTLDERLRREGVRIEWLQFGSGPLLFEAFNANSLDVGHAADAPTAFAQAAGIPFVYVAAEPAYSRGLALLTPAGSVVRNVADLKGKRVAIGHGWNCEYQLVRALEEAGLQYSDIKPVYVKSAADARAVLESNSADAVGLWDPFYAVVELEDRPRVLRDGQGLTPNYTFLVATPECVQTRPQLIRALMEELIKVDDWANQHPEEVAALLSKDLGVGQEALRRATQRREYGVHPVDAETVAAQQRLADKFFEIGELPAKIDVRKAVPADAPWWPAPVGG